MPELVKIARLDQIKPSKMFRATLQKQAILLANINGELFAIDDMCSHEDASLYNGALKGFCVECPLHGSHFDFRTGNPDGSPATEAVKTYKVEVENDDVYIYL